MAEEETFVTWRTADLLNVVCCKVSSEKLTKVQLVKMVAQL